MNPDKYRFYRVDDTGRLHDVREISAVNDEEALARVSEEYPDSLCEIWYGERLVSRHEGERWSSESARA